LECFLILGHGRSAISTYACTTTKPRPFIHVHQRLIQYRRQ
jgi:hypothetical protein